MRNINANVDIAYSELLKKNTLLFVRKKYLPFDGPFCQIKHTMQSCFVEWVRFLLQVEVGGGTLKASTSMGAEEFLPMLIYCLAQYNFLTVEVETQYIWAFLPPHMQTREPGYYLTALSSAG